MAFFPSEDFSLDPRFIELQEELRSVLFAGLSGLSPSASCTPEAESAPTETPQTLNFSSVTVNVPNDRLVCYLQNWVTECAPYLDKFDQDKHFQIHVPLMAQKSPALLYAMLAFSSRQMERRGLTQEGGCDSLELYQESIRLLSPGLQAKDPNMLVTACILAVFELMSGGSKNWKRHVEGCASLFEFFGVDGFSGGLPQAVFWCYARMELCGAIISDGTETAVLPLSKWAPSAPESLISSEQVERYVRDMFHQRSRDSPDMQANWAIYLCTKVCDLRFRRTQSLELGRTDVHDDRPFQEQWQQLWNELQFWLDERPATMRPISMVEAGDKQIFPAMLFPHWAAISSNQMYHTACILMLEMRHLGHDLDSQCLALWHARQAEAKRTGIAPEVDIIMSGTTVPLTFEMSSPRPIISVLGSLNIDLVSYVPHHPLPGETITSSRFNVFPGGKGANQAVACAKLSRTPDLKNPSVDVAMIGAVGADAYGSVLLDSLKSYDVGTESIIVKRDAGAESQSGIAMIIVDEPTGQNRIILSPGANESLRPSQFNEIPGPKPALLIMQLEVPLDTVLQAFKAAKAMGTPVLLNPAPAQVLPAEVYQGLAHLILNETEAALLSGKDESEFEDNSVVEKAASDFLAKGVRNVVITLGGKGAYYANGAGLKGLIPALKVEVVDTTAAGDTFIGAYAVEFAGAEKRSEMFDIEKAVRLGIKASSKTVVRRGAQVSIPWKDELE
ncbi:hypothetical protein F53441_2361 [Fusarium austroafricanum]|uniref:Ribokinase n=1 Tax=Fusarium austroafricanum TaxID=2364996 RepID=A0A8H4KRJ7_9HYPO|nr:hypothetical protein F53441_2361 [Fusarium austroafricanum]